MLLKILRCLTDNITYYIPSRIAEGYGLHNESIDRIREEGGEFIVTVDCGSSSPNEIAYARSLGIDMVVTDHHNMKDEPVNELIINPRAPGDTYPFKVCPAWGVAISWAGGQPEAGDSPPGDFRGAGICGYRNHRGYHAVAGRRTDPS